MTEVWVQHPRYSLTVSSQGRVKGPRGLRKFRLDRYGYARLNLRYEGKTVTVLVHVLVSECFIGLRNGLTVNHIDGCKTNNDLKNLEIISSADNLRHAYRTGLVSNCHPIAGCYSRREAERKLGIPRQMPFKLAENFKCKEVA